MRISVNSDVSDTSPLREYCLRTSFELLYFTIFASATRVVLLILALSRTQTLSSKSISKLATDLSPLSFPSKFVFQSGKGSSSQSLFRTPNVAGTL